MSELEKFEKAEEELKIDSMNKSEASEYTHLFIRLSSMVGYSVILALALCCYIIAISLITLTDSVYESGIPKVSLYREYFAFCGPTFFMIFAASICNTYNSELANHGLKNSFKGFMTLAFVYGLVVFLLISIYTFVLVYLISSFGLDLMVGEGLLYVIMIITVIYIWIRFLIKIKKLTMPLISSFKLEYLEQIESKENIIIKDKGSSLLQIIDILGTLLLMFVFCCYYVFFVTIWFRSNNNVMRGIIALIFHPIIVELLLTIIKFGRGSNKNLIHPFYHHLYTENVEALLHLYRRFLFNDLDSIPLTLIFVFISGIEELLARGYMEKKEILLRKFLGSKPLSDIDLVTKRRYFTYSNTSRSIIELVSIILAPVMLVCFSSNRFAVDLGYNGLEAINLKSLFVSVVIQLTIELLVLYLCSLMEKRQGLPMSDFFFQFRGSSVFFCHFLWFCCAQHWILHNLKTVPNSVLCFDVNDPCSCNFNVYTSLCDALKSSNGSTNVSSIALFQKSNDIISSTFSLNNIPSLISIFGIICIILVSYLITKRLEKQNVKETKHKIERRKGAVKDAVTSILMERSALQKAIFTIESLCRGVSPSQSKLLQHVIEILKNQSKEHNNIIDIESLLKNSGEFKEVLMFLNDQLMHHEENDNLKRKIEVLKRGLSFSDKNRFLSNNDEIDLKERQIKMENHGHESIAYDDNTIPHLSIKVEKSIPESKDDTALNEFLSWDFNVFAIKNKSPQSFLALNCFNKWKLVEELKLAHLQLSNMLMYVEQHYSLVNYDSYPAYGEMNVSLISTKKLDDDGKGNPYHNNLHGADVFQAVLFFCTCYKDIGGNFSSFDLFSVLFAAYIHDFNHPGLNTTYVNSDWPMSGISSTFGIDSPLEKHHLAMVFNLMRNVEEYNFLISCSSSEMNTFRRIVTECVLATDLAKSMPWLSTSRITLNDFRSDKSMRKNENIVIEDKMRSEMEKKEMDHKILLMQLAIKCADVGHPSRLLEQHLEWSSRICAEFYCQGDKERDKGMKISPLCDRNVSSSNYPQSQIGFINFVSKPCFTLLNEVCLSVSDDEKPWLKYMKLNIEYWEEKKKEKSNLSTV